jgi:integrase
MGKEVTISAVTHPRYNWCVTFLQGQSSNGRALRRKAYFKFKGDAREFAATKKLELGNHGRKTEEISNEERRAVLTFREQISGFGSVEGIPKLTDAVAFYIRYLKASIKRSTVSKLADELEASKDRAGRSKRHVDDLRSRLQHFSRSFGDRDVRTVTRDEIEGWLHGLKLAPQTLVNYRRVVFGLFREGLRRKYCETNPVADIDTPKVVGQAPGILSPAKMAKLIKLVMLHEPELLPWLVVSGFCGLRPAEVDRLDWREIRLHDTTPVVEVTATKAKTARRRLVELPENALAFLRPLGRGEGALRVVNHRKKWEAVRRLAGYGEPGSETAEEREGGVVLQEWPADGLRHSFASYHIAHFKDAGRTALALGHGQNPSLLFNTYRAMVTPDDAARWWQITPEGPDSKIVEFAKAS